MKRGSTAFLQIVVVLFGLAALAFMLLEPQVEGRNANATQLEVYFKDPLLAYAYVASIPFFVALYQAFKVLGYAGRNRVFSPEAVKAVRTMKYCAIAMVGFIVVSFAFMAFADPADDDGPQGVMMRLFVAVPTIVAAAAAGMFERLLQNAVEMKSENDLTV